MLWLHDRTVPEVVRDAHSLWFETAAELGIVGLALLLALFGGVAWSAAVARRRVPAAVAGPAAALAVWAAHSALDWDWEMPGGPTLTALVLAGLLIVLADEPVPGTVVAVQVHERQHPIEGWSGPGWRPHFAGLDEPRWVEMRETHRISGARAAMREMPHRPNPPPRCRR